MNMRSVTEIRILCSDKKWLAIFPFVILAQEIQTKSHRGMPTHYVILNIVTIDLSARNEVESNLLIRPELNNVSPTKTSRKVGEHTTLPAHITAISSLSMQILRLLKKS